MADRGGPGLVLTDEWGFPVVVSMSSTHAMNPRMVGERVALLATAKGLGLPVADGLAVTFAGLETMDTRSQLRRALPCVRGLVRIGLTDRALRQDVGDGSWHGTVNTWDDLVDGLDEVMARDRTENPGRQGRKRGMIIQRVPPNSHSAVLDVDWDRASTIRAISDGLPPSRTTHNGLRRLARLTMIRLVRPVTLEVLLLKRGDGAVIVDLQELTRGRDTCDIASAGRGLSHPTYRRHSDIDEDSP